ncbi:alpha-L-fucosidase [Liquorilactobacillus vini]|uniref:alpha-L-fucosidase n=1 Tax=Liquorilactobacillus vini DSM 20605 TaxID=1133569 RepID=A0A0R2BXE5_9LACO|nr:alpha-L-fucosidase [Liquorilactobacillus vini]KRM83944.1 glycoside hydrolase family 29 [Liquorilactobacillus vini DSM 20605]
MTLIFKRIADYEQLGIGLFIHWGLYSQLEVGEWTELIHQRKKEKYEHLRNSFTASQFHPRQVVQCAKSLGAKYIVLTAKHHEGFFLYDTKGLSSFDALHSPAKRDLIREFVNACNEENIKPFIYIATYDWHSKLYEKDFNKYLQYLKKSVEVLCKYYGKISGFWFDGNWNKKQANWHLDELYGMIRHYQPDAIIINNTGLKNRGKISNPEIDAVTYERGCPQKVNHNNQEKYISGEMSLTLNNHWGIATNDLDYKSPREIIESIAHARQIGANILINIGLTGNGEIPELCKNYLKLIGKWVKMTKNILYYGKATDIKATSPKDFALKMNDSFYLFVFNLRIRGNENVVLGGEKVSSRTFLNFHKRVEKVSWLDNNEELMFHQNLKENSLTVAATGFDYGTDWIVRVAKVI